MNEWKWIVLAGVFTGDGSPTHRLFRNKDGNRLPLFNSRAAAEEYVLAHKAGQDCLIAEVVVTAHQVVNAEYDAGFDARQRGYTLAANPHEPCSEAHKRWTDGWVDLSYHLIYRDQAMRSIGF